MISNTRGNKTYRIIITSDVHYYQRDWYGVPVGDRVQRWVDSILEEHKREPIDLLIYAGDMSLDHYLDKGAYTAKGISEANIFMKRYASQLKGVIPAFFAPGNHELYSDGQWMEYTGNGRYGAVALEDDLFIILDTFRTSLEPNFDRQLAAYTPVDVGFIKEQMAAYPEHRVWLVAHYFDARNESEEFKALLRNNERIKGLFSGHSHQASVVPLGKEFGDLSVAQTGNFSYSYFTAYPTGNVEDVLNSFWGYRELIISQTHAQSSYILADSGEFSIGEEIYSIQRRKLNTVQYY